MTIALAGPQAVAGGATGWWYMLSVGGRGTATGLVYAGIAALCLAWLGLGRFAAGTRTGELLVIGGLWVAPLALGPALFSHDAYSYLAQGTVLHLGRNPYHVAPDVLAGLHHGRVLAAVSPFWRHTTAPYGPLFLGLMSLLVGITGSHLVAGILLVRVLELVGIALLARYIPRLARALGSDPGRAVWLALLSPLLMLQLVAAGHNDVLMAGLLVAGVTVALQGRPLAGIALCALAATFKVPALAGAAFIAVAWVREERTTTDRVRLLGVSVLLSAAVLAAVSLATGVGASWLSGSVLATPGRVRLAITPSTGLGYTVSSVLHDFGFAVNSRSVEHAFSTVATALTVLLGLWLLVRVRVARLAPSLGLLLLVAAGGGPAAWPWYFSWGLVLLAACPRWQGSWPLIGGVVVAAFLIKPNGILALPLPTAPAVTALYALLAVLLWRSDRAGRGRGRGDRGTLPPRRDQSARGDCDHARPALTLAAHGTV